MSGIYIPGMEMPTKCDDCEVLSDDLVCPFTGLRGYNGKPEICPLIEVPDHGRLIDADALFEEVYKVWGTEYDASECNSLMSFINAAPTIIPAEETPAKDINAPTGPYDLLYEEGGPDA